jgi:hypothetical protein
MSIHSIKKCQIEQLDQTPNAPRKDDPQRPPDDHYGHTQEDRLESVKANQLVLVVRLQNQKNDPGYPPQQVTWSGRGVLRQSGGRYRRQIDGRGAGAAGSTAVPHFAQ